MELTIRGIFPLLLSGLYRRRVRERVAYLLTYTSTILIHTKYSTVQYLTYDEQRTSEDSENNTNVLNQRPESEVAKQRLR